MASIEDIIGGLRAKISEEHVVRFNIIRRSVWDSTLRTMERPNFSPEKRLDIKFTDDDGLSEGAVDFGAPKREFFRSCLQELKDSSGMFEGPSNSKFLGCNLTATRTDAYYRAGQLMAMSIVHGGQTPCFLSEKLVQALIKGPQTVEVTVEDIADMDTQSALKELRESENEAQLMEAVRETEHLLSVSGCSKRITLSNKDDVSKDLAHWYVLQRTRTPFERFKEGLASLGVLEALQQHPQKMKTFFFKPTKKLSAVDLESLFKCRLSEKESNRFEWECRTLGFWRDYLQDAEFDMQAVTLEEILIFATGCETPPALGFSPEPSVEFLADSKFPTANTSDNVIRVPVKDTYEEFKNDMDFGIKNSSGFGMA
ncbi:G2/M phase-specific E3 ubiquitin-protein ligase [Anguilla anguilla]|uniref:HECT-type E3 ubiquitin transferase n=1 Tax=Anguilla anguilla TaxID=7936 RepID=A0A9D3M0T4_ANGAN|nr:G2/M phase-specific E3 ubiquitin-protein ligase [Anguilla anguilla]KAG5838518.1 hypothetical protein ANANG_G00224510 [Anguilla anguilla]